MFKLTKSDYLFLTPLVLLSIVSFFLRTGTAHWLLEILPAFLFFGIYPSLNRKIKFSLTAKISLFLFFLMHQYAIFYAYRPPIGDWVFWDTLFQTSRNHFDRILHFAFGVFWTIPFIELYKHLKIKAPLVHTLLWVIALSAVYEMLEWGAAVYFGQAGTDFIGMQGDVWDSHVDMFLATIGSIIVLIGYRIKK